MTEILEDEQEEDKSPEIDNIIWKSKGPPLDINNVDIIIHDEHQNEIEEEKNSYDSSEEFFDVETNELRRKITKRLEIDIDSSSDSDVGSSNSKNDSLRERFKKK